MLQKPATCIEKNNIHFGMEETCRCKDHVKRGTTLSAMSSCLHMLEQIIRDTMCLRGTTFSFRINRKHVVSDVARFSRNRSKNVVTLQSCKNNCYKDLLTLNMIISTITFFAIAIGLEFEYYVLHHPVAIVDAYTTFQAVSYRVPAAMGQIKDMNNILRYIIQRNNPLGIASYQSNNGSKLNNIVRIAIQTCQDLSVRLSAVLRS